jgi:hypothetical protein
MTAIRTLTTLLKHTGPIKTFYISLKGAAYTELKLIYHEKHPKAQNIKHKVSPPKEVVTNSIVVEVDIDQDYKHEAARIAYLEGRVPSPCIGSPNENQATLFLIRIAARAEYRQKYRSLFSKFIKDIREAWHKKRLSLPDPRAPDYLGWRVWHWDPVKKRLISPSQKTVWDTPELRVEVWNHSDVVRGHAGIHAARMPYNWREASLEGTELAGFFKTFAFNGKRWESHGVGIIGVVERFGKYVLGTEGWRAEWVIIKALKAPSTEIGLELEAVYPDVEIYYENR